MSEFRISQDELDSLTPVEREALISIMREVSEDGTSSTVSEILSEDYEEFPVDIDTFLDDPQYIGGQLDIYPFWRDKLREIFSKGDDLQEIILTGAIGVGKTTIAVVGMSYILYRLMCLKNPAKYYGIGSNSKIVFAFFNVGLDLSYGVAYSKLNSLLMNSPWFMERGRIYGKNEKKQFYLPNKKIEFRVGSQDRHGLGQDIFCLTGDTVILTPYGEKTLEELDGSYAYVISVDENMNQSCSNVCEVRRTGIAKELICITLEDGTSIRCTPEHRLLLKSGEYVMAKDLKENDDIEDVLVEC